MNSNLLKKMMSVCILAGGGMAYHVYTLELELIRIAGFTIQPLRAKIYLVAGVIVLSMILVYFFGQSHHKKLEKEIAEANKKTKKKKKKVEEEDTQSWGSVIGDATSKKRDIV